MNQEELQVTKAKKQDLLMISPIMKKLKIGEVSQYERQ